MSTELEICAHSIFFLNVLYDRSRLKAYYPKSNFVQPKVGEWAPIKNLGFGMQPDDEQKNTSASSSSPSSNSKQLFRFYHSKYYQKIEKNFRLAIELHQDHEFMGILQQKPYHSNTLMTMADVYSVL